MARIKFRVKVERVVEVETENYHDEYDDACEAAGTGPEAEVPVAFVQEAFTKELEEGLLSLDETLEDAAFDVELA